MENKCIEVQRERGLRVFLDLNETLIRTGQVSLPDRLEEQRQLDDFLAECHRLAIALGSLRIVFLTGNSFEYARRIEEPLGLKNMAGLSLAIVSENGLVARSFDKGDLWRARLLPAYQEAVGSLLEAAEANSVLAGRFYSQGNELRTTLKPVVNEFSEKELAELVRLTETCGGTSLFRFHGHRFYFDIDPAQVVLDGKQMSFSGKQYAVQRLVAGSPALNLAIGDSDSDVSMFRAVNRLGGRSFWVANASQTLDREVAEKLTGTFTAGVNEMLRAIEVGR